MDYFNLLNFQKEPFSNSPEPEFLYASDQHGACLQMLELAVRLRRGLNVVIGDVGTGKTTLCRKLIQNLCVPVSEAPDIETHLILDPQAASGKDFLLAVASVLGVTPPAPDEPIWAIKEKIKDCLFEKGVDQDRTVVLIIDEGQKLSRESLEILREFLNYETNSFKLLQIVIFAQEELDGMLGDMPNLVDRINLIFRLKPLNFRQTREMINHRIRMARQSDLIQGPILTYGGMLVVYHLTGGFPRKIVSLCHQVLLKLIIRAKPEAGFFFVLGCCTAMASPKARSIQWAAAGVLLGTILVGGGLYYLQSGPLYAPWGNVSAAVPLTIEHSQTVLPVAVESTSIDQRLENPAMGEAKAIPPAHKPNETAMPKLLGTLTVQKGMTLSVILHSIYGRVDSILMAAVLVENPWIRNVHTIREGDRLRLPTHRAQSTKNLLQVLVVLDEDEDIDALYRRYWQRTVSSGDANAVIFSSWDTASGFKHRIVSPSSYEHDSQSKADSQFLRDDDQKTVFVTAGINDQSVYFNRGENLYNAQPEGR